MPVFNKAALTKHCLETIRPTLEGAGDGEIIVIDNASSDETPEMLSAFPWVRVVRNERNLGFSGANNQGARLASGEFLVLLNNDIEAKPGWLAAMLARACEPDVGAVGAKLLFPDGTLQHAGVAVSPFRFGSAGFGAFHDMYRLPSSYPPANVPAEMRIVTGACLVTPRALYAELGGLDEGFWNGYEDVDYCLKVGAKGLRVLYEPRAVLTHFESQSGPQRFRKVPYNIARLDDRWNDRIVLDHNEHHLRRHTVRREVRATQRVHQFVVQPAPKTTVILHGDTGVPPPAALAANDAQIAKTLRVETGAAVDAIREEMEIRGDRYVAIVDVRTALEPGWLDELVRQVEFSWNVGAATIAAELPLGEDVNPLAAAAGCTLLSLRAFPQGLRLGAFARPDAAVADLLVRALDVRAVTRGAGFARAIPPPVAPDPAFEAAWGFPIAEIFLTDPERIEPFLGPKPFAVRPLVSILMLSWNAPEYTQLALQSIRAHTTPPYEVVIVDNGSGETTTDWLRTLEDVRVIYNKTNRGFAGGSNQAIAAARGEYCVLLNNDTIVTDGWLDGLLDAFARVPGLGVSAVRSNRVAGIQMVEDARYGDEAGIHAYAAARRARYRKQGFVLDRAIGLCLCFPRSLVDEIGGIDERFGVGNFEDDDFCLRVRAAGYRIYVCDDVFIHHFGSKTFAANKIDYRTTMDQNWAKFAQKWDLQKLAGIDAYDARAAHARGFDRARHFVPLPHVEAFAAPPKPDEKAYATVFTAVVADESDWHAVGAFARRYARAFSADDATLLAIAATGELDAVTLGARVRKVLEKLDIREDRSADVLVSDEVDVAAWREGLPAGAERAEIPADQSPSALRRTYGGSER